MMIQLLEGPQFDTVWNDGQEGFIAQGKWSMNTDFHGDKGVHLFTVRTPYTRCKSLRKSV